MFVVLGVGYLLMPGQASSHREAPLVSGDPQADTTDVYAFVSPDAPDTVTLISSWIPFENPQGGPNFYRFGDSVLYEFKIDNNADGVEDISYQFRFTSQVRNPNTFLYNTGPITQASTIRIGICTRPTPSAASRAGAPCSPPVPCSTMYDNVGPASAPTYGGRGSGIYTFQQADGGSGLVFAGQTDDPFFLDLRVFDLLYGANLSETGVDSLAGFNVHSLALRVPKASLRASSPIIGVWATASRPTTTTRAERIRGHQRQLSCRFRGWGCRSSTRWSFRSGRRTSGTAAGRLTMRSFSATSRILKCRGCCEAVYGLRAPATPRNDLVQVFLTGVPNLNQPSGVRASEMLRLNTDILPSAGPARLGVLAGDVSGFPNGRRLTDDVVDITLAGGGWRAGRRAVDARRRRGQERRAVQADVPVPRVPSFGRQPVEAESESAPGRLTVMRKWLSPDLPGSVRDHHRGRGDGGPRRTAERRRAHRRSSFSAAGARRPGRSSGVPRRSGAPGCRHGGRASPGSRTMSAQRCCLRTRCCARPASPAARGSRFERSGAAQDGTEGGAGALWREPDARRGVPVAAPIS